MKSSLNKTMYRVVIICLTFTFGAILVSYLINPASAEEENAHQSANLYPTNSSGQTYGSELNAATPDERPDLIQAYGIDGTIGYVYKKDLDGPTPKTPTEALKIQNNRKAEYRAIPLYEADGKHVIGEFRVSNPGVQQNS